LIIIAVALPGFNVTLRAWPWSAPANRIRATDRWVRCGNLGGQIRRRMLPLKNCLGTGKMGHQATAVLAIAAGPGDRSAGRSRWAPMVELTPLARTEVSATGGLTPARTGRTHLFRRSNTDGARCDGRDMAIDSAGEKSTGCGVCGKQRKRARTEWMNDWRMT